MNLLSPQWMLLLGIILSLFIRSNSLKRKARVISSKLLQVSIIFLGASLNFHSVIEQGSEGVLVTFVSIIIVFSMGFIGMNLLGLERVQSLLITMGTAICGGSAIGALAPVLRAEPLAITVAISVVFLLNAISVFIFPSLGEVFYLTQEQFGLWAALAIHDTSSVAAASTLYGQEALAVATTVKLTRALWIIPITLFFSISRKDQNRKGIYIPWFIAGFLTFSLIFIFSRNI